MIPLSTILSFTTSYILGGTKTYKKNVNNPIKHWNTIHFYDWGRNVEL